jgi:hypothetical protein
VTVLGVIGRVSPFGQVTMAAAWSRVNPPSMAGCTGAGLMTTVCRAAARAARGVTVLQAKSPNTSNSMASWPSSSDSRTTASWLSAPAA